MPSTDGRPAGSAITEIAPGHYHLELDAAQGSIEDQLRGLLFDPLARRGVRVYVSIGAVGPTPRAMLETLQSIELKFRIHGGGIGIISDNTDLLRCLRVTGLSDLLPTYHSVQMALESGRRMQDYQTNLFLAAG
jgi:hypothetical protein